MMLYKISVFFYELHYSGFRNKEIKVDALFQGLLSFYIQTFKAMLNNKSYIYFEVNEQYQQHFE